MVDLRVQQTDSGAERAAAVSRDGGGSGHQPGGDDSPSHYDAPAGAEELAIALESDRGDALTARYEVDGNGDPLIRILDRTRNETVALITPEELKTLAEDTGLPPGLLVRVSS